MADFLRVVCLFTDCWFSLSRKMRLAFLVKTPQLGAGQKVQGGGGPEEMKTWFLKKNMTHPLRVAQNFGDPPLTLG